MIVKHAGHPSTDIYTKIIEQKYSISHAALEYAVRFSMEFHDQETIGPSYDYDTDDGSTIMSSNYDRAWRKYQLNYSHSAITNVINGGITYAGVQLQTDDPEIELRETYNEGYAPSLQCVVMLP